METFSKKYFAQEDINTGRQSFIDIARTVAILGMVVIHLLDCHMCTAREAYPELYRFFSCITGGVLSAPIFMFCMGIGITYSRNASYETMKSRAGNLFEKGIILNVLRDVIPMSLLWLVLRTDEVLHMANEGLFDLDILPFAALAFLLMAFMKKWSVPTWAIFVLSLVMSLCASFTHLTATGNWYIDFFNGLFFGVWGAEFDICFPLFNWFATVAAGYLFGTFYRRCLHPEKFLAVLAVISLPVFVGYTAWAYPQELMLFREDDNFYYYMNIFDTLYCFSVFGVFLYLYYQIAKVLNGALTNICGTISRNINEFYMVHWIIIGFIKAICMYLNRSFGLCETMVLSLLITICAYYISYYWCESKRPKIITNN